MPSFLEGLYGKVAKGVGAVVEKGQDIWQQLTTPGDPHFKSSGEPYTRADLLQQQPTQLITDTVEAQADIIAGRKPMPEAAKPKPWQTTAGYEARANLEHLIAGMDKQAPMLLMDGRVTPSVLTLDITLHQINQYAKKKLLSPEQIAHYRKFAIQEQAKQARHNLKPVQDAAGQWTLAADDKSVEELIKGIQRVARSEGAEKEAKEVLLGPEPKRLPVEGMLIGPDGKPMPRIKMPSPTSADFPKTAAELQERVAFTRESPVAPSGEDPLAITTPVGTLEVIGRAIDKPRDYVAQHILGPLMGIDLTRRKPNESWAETLMRENNVIGFTDPNYSTEAWAAPGNQTKWVGAMSAGIFLDVFSDPLTALGIGLGRRAATGWDAVRAMQRGLGRMAKAGGDAAEAARILRNTEHLLPLVGEGAPGMYAFGKGFYVRPVGGHFEAILKASGLEGAAQHADTALRFTQDAVRNQFRLLGYEARPFLRRGAPPLIDYEARVIKETEKAFAGAERLALRELGKGRNPHQVGVFLEGQAETIAQGRQNAVERIFADFGVTDPALSAAAREETMGRLTADMSVFQDQYIKSVVRGRTGQIMRAQDSLWRHPVRWVQKRFQPFSAAQGVPEAWADRMKDVGHRYLLHRDEWPRQATALFRNLDDLGEPETVRRFLGWMIGSDEQIVRLGQVARTQATPTGMPWALDEATQLRKALEFNGEYTGPGQIDNLMGRLASRRPLSPQINGAIEEIGFTDFVQDASYMLPDGRLVQKAARAHFEEFLEMGLEGAGQELRAAGVARITSSGKMLGIESHGALTAAQKRTISNVAETFDQLALDIYHPQTGKLLTSIQPDVVTQMTIGQSLRQADEAVTPAAFSMDRLPAKTQKLYRVKNEVQGWWRGMREMVVDWQEFGDIGMSYQTALPVSAARRAAAPALPASRQSFMYQSKGISPYWSEILETMGEEGIPALQQDPMKLMNFWARGAAEAELYQNVTTLVDDVGVRLPAALMARYPNAPAVVGLESLSSGRAGWQAAKGAEEVFVPLGLQDYVKFIKTEPGPWREGWRALAAPGRTMQLASVRFIFANIPEQPANMLMGEGLRLGRHREMAEGIRALSGAVSENILEARRLSLPRTQRLLGQFDVPIEKGLQLGELKLLDGAGWVNEKIFHRISNNMIADRIGQFFGSGPVSPGLMDDVVKNLSDGAVYRTGPSSYFTRELDWLGGNLGGLGRGMRGALGFVPQQVGKMEDFSRGLNYAMNRLMLKSHDDAIREGAWGFVQYGKAFNSPVDDWVRDAFYFWPYIRQRSYQIPGALMRKPWVGYIPYRMRESWIDTNFTDREKFLLSKRPLAERLAWNILPWKWELPPFSWVADSIPQTVKDYSIPSLAIRWPMAEWFGDVTRYGWNWEQGKYELHPGKAAGSALHPIGKWAFGVKEGSPLQAAHDIVPLWGQIDRFIAKHKPSTPEDRKKMAEWFQVAEDTGLRTPEVLDGIWDTRAAQSSLSDIGGQLTKVDFLPQVYTQMSWEDKEQFNASRRLDGLDPWGATNTDVLRINKELSEDRSVWTGERRPTIATDEEGKPLKVTKEQLNELIYSDPPQSITGLIDEMHDDAAARQNEQMGLREWLSAPAGTPPSEQMRAEINARLAKAPEDYPLITMEELEGLAADPQSANATALERAYSQLGETCTAAYCSRFVQQSITGGRSGFGHAKQLTESGQLEKWGYEKMPPGTAPQDGDVVWHPSSSEHGDINFAMPEINGGPLQLYGAGTGRIGYKPVPTDRELRIFRPKQTTSLRLLLDNLP